MKIKREDDGTLTLTGVRFDPTPRRSGKDRDGKCYLAIKDAIKVRGMLADEPQREVTINVTCYPPVDPSAASSAVDISA